MRLTRLARFSGLGGALTFVGTVALLPSWQPGYDPRRQLMSELANGPHGGALLAAFLGLAVAIAACAGVLASHRAARPLVVPLGLSAVCIGAAGVLSLHRQPEAHVGLVAAGFGLACAGVAGLPLLRAAVVRGRSRLSWAFGGAMIGSLGLAAVLPFGLVQRAAAACFVGWILWCLLVVREAGADERRGV